MLIGKKSYIKKCFIKRKVVIDKEIKKSYEKLQKLRRLNKNLIAMSDYAFEKMQLAIIDIEDDRIEEAFLAIVDYVNYQMRLSDATLIEIIETLESQTTKIRRIEQNG